MIDVVGNDVVFMGEQIIVGLDSIRTPSTDTVALTDGSQGEIILGRDPFDTAAVTDQIKIDSSYERILAETLAVSDTVDGDRFVLNDNLALTESLGVQMEFLRENADALVVTDARTTELYGERAGNDTVAITEQLTIDRVFAFDSVSITDSTAITLYKSLSDTISVVDSLISSTSYVRDVGTDSLVVTETILAEKLRIYDVAASDTIALTDSSSSERTIGRDPFDAINATDSTARSLQYAIVLTDTAVLSDSPAITVYKNPSDTIAVTDTSFTDITRSRTAADAVVLTEQLIVARSIDRAASDAITSTDQAFSGSTRNVVVAGDAIGLTDFNLAEIVNIDVNVSDTIFVADAIARESSLQRTLTDAVVVTDTVTGLRGGVVDRILTDTLAATDDLKTLLWPSFEDDLQIFDQAQVELVGSFPIVADNDGFGLTITFPQELSYDRTGDLRLYNFRPGFGSRGVPFEVETVTPVTTVLQSGTTGRALDTGNPDFLSNVFRISGSDPVSKSSVVGHEVTASEAFEAFDMLEVELTGSSTVTYTEGFDPSVDVGRYIVLSNGRAPGLYRIVGVTNAAQVTLDKPLPLVDPMNGSLAWDFTTAVQGFAFRTTNKITNQSGYHFDVGGLRTIAGQPFHASADFITLGIQGPRISNVALDSEGTLSLTYDQPMLSDRDLVSPDEYSVTGPTDVAVQRVWSVDPTTVAMELGNLGVGSYSLSVNIFGTPKDSAGNPIDPSFSQAIFTGSVPLTTRSVFTDKGPIAKPGLSLQSGVNAVLENWTEITLPGATLNPTFIGNYIVLTGSAVNGGTYQITGIVSPTRARVQASFILPDSSTLTWELLDPRNGEIADDPSDVTVLVNGTPVTPVGVVGLLGQVILPTAPTPTDDVKINYSWCSNPTVEFRRLNSKEFRLNSWNNNAGYGIGQHKYRYNNTLVRPSDYESLDMLATIDQPEVRDLYYRAYERAYTPTLNDPGTLLLNSPIHKIAFPPAQRTLSETFITYEATELPEFASPVWKRVGLGTTTISAGLLTVTTTTSGTFPVGQPLFWTQALDLTFPHTFALSWRFFGGAVAVYNGVFSGLACGYSDDKTVFVVGFLLDGGVKKIGLLKRGFGDDPSDITAWGGGLDSTGAPTGEPVAFNWNILHSYRLFRAPSGLVKIFVDGNIGASLQATPDEAPFLEELNAHFDEIQGVFFGSLSRETQNVSTWDFVRYLILPTNPLQTSPSSFVSYEANVLPEVDSRPWTPIGFHGTESIVLNQTLLLDSTSATDAPTASEVGLIGGDFRGFVRLEPLLSSASQVVLDIAPQLRTQTHGIDPYGLMAAVDDGTYLMQVAFFPHLATPKFSYGGRSLPEDYSPYIWTPMGGSTAEMAGRILKISDDTVGDGKVYFIDDLAPMGSDERVVASDTDYIFEFRNRVLSFTVDVGGFAGVFGQVYDGARSVGLMFEVQAGVQYVTFNSDGVSLGPSARFAFGWGDGAFHTYRFSKSTTGDLVTLFIDGTFVGSVNYSAFAAIPGTPIISFGSSSPASADALSVVEWAYCNTWRVRSDLKRYVGIWKGFDNDSLTGYHLPLKASGRNAQVVGNALGDPAADFIAANVVVGDLLVVDDGSNKGTYEVAGVSGTDSLTIVGTWPSNPTLVSYRIVKETDWSSQHKYRLSRDTTGLITLFFDSDPDPLIQIGYDSIDLPTSGTGIVSTLSDGLAAIAFGSFDSENLEQSSWDYVRYGITRTPTNMLIAPHHQFLNQRNVMESPERLFTSLAHTLTDFESSSTGIVPKKDPEFLGSAGLPAFTRLNDSTPLVPSTQTYEVRHPTPVQQFVSALNDPADLLNTLSFVLNDGTVQFRLIIPNDILYTSLDVIENTVGETSLITPFGDDHNPAFGGVQYTKEVCLDYVPNTLPEDDVASPTPWVRQSSIPSQVTASVSGGILTYRTTGSATVYKNNTTLPDAPGLQTEAKFKLKLVDDTTLGTGDTQVRFGLSAPGLTVALAFVTTPLAERYVLITDLNNGNNLGAISFDFLDGLFHTYKIVRDPGAGVVRVSIDS